MSDLMPCAGDAYVPIVARLPLFPREYYLSCTFCIHAAHELWCGCGVTDDVGKCLGRLGFAFAGVAGVGLEAFDE